MVAHDYQAGKTTSPVNFKIEDGRPVPDEPHIGSKTDVPDRPTSVQAGFVRGGTTRPTEGQSGDVEQLDNDGKPTKVHPGEVARAMREEGPQAAAEKVGGGTPPGDPEPSSKTAKKGK